MTARNRTVVVLGGGIVGSFIAMRLAEQGARLMVVDPNDTPHSASGLSFALISALGQEPVEYYLLNCRGIAGWRGFARAHDDDLGLVWGGHVRWTDDPIAASQLERTVATASAHGYPVRMMGAAGVKRRLPACEPGDVLAAAYAPEDGHVEPARVIAACRAAVVAGGGEVILGHRAELNVDDMGLCVKFGEHAIRPGRVVIAAGAESVHVAERVGLDIPTTASSGLVVVTERVAELTPGTVEFPGGVGRRAFLRHRPDGSVLIAEESDEGTAVEPTPEHGRAIRDRAARYFPPLRDAEVIETAVVWRSMPLDHLPIVGPLPGLPSLYVAVAPRGVTLAPVIGELVAKELTTGRVQPQLDHFRPSRFGRRIARTVLELESIFEDTGTE